MGMRGIMENKAIGLSASGMEGEIETTTSL